MTTEERLQRIEAHLGIEVTKSKTTLDWLNELPDGYRERALANYTGWLDGSSMDNTVSMANAIMKGWEWNASPEGYDFWEKVWGHYMRNTPLPPLPVEQPNQEDVEQAKVYNAGFHFEYNGEAKLSMPDNTHLIYFNGRWAKKVFLCHAQPHTLKPVEKHTVGKFYAIAGAFGEHLNDYRNYALCVKTGDTNSFVRASTEYSIVLVERARERDVTLFEVTPL